MSWPPRIMALPALAGLLVAGPVAAQSDDLATGITIGRLAVLIDRAAEVLSIRECASPDRPPDGLDDQDPAGRYRSLYSAWLDLEGLRARACGAEALSGEICAHRFAPSWLRPPGSFTPTAEEVADWADELQSAVLEVTGPICALAAETGDAEEGPGACSVD